METLSIPEGYQRIMPYLIINNAAAFQSFMQRVFSAKEKYKAMRDENTIMHAEVKVGDSVIMFADATDEFERNTAGMFIYVENVDETYNKALAEGSTSKMKPADMEYGRTCGITDPFGNVWWITSPPK
jgi:PhnB protein